MRMDSRKIAFLGIYVAIIIALTYIPFTGYITIGVISLVNIPIVVVVASVHLGFAGAIASSFTFGITAYINSIIFGSPLSDPLVFMVSRFVLGFIIGGIVHFININKMWKFILLTIFTYVINTMLVTGSIFIANQYNEIWSSGFNEWIIVIWLAFIIEISIGIFLSVPLYSLVKYIKERDQLEANNKW